MTKYVVSLLAVVGLAASPAFADNFKGQQGLDYKQGYTQDYKEDYKQDYTQDQKQDYTQDYKEDYKQGYAPGQQVAPAPVAPAPTVAPGCQLFAENQIVAQGGTALFFRNYDVQLDIDVRSGLFGMPTAVVTKRAIGGHSFDAGGDEYETFQIESIILTGSPASAQIIVDLRNRPWQVFDLVCY